MRTIAVLAGAMLLSLAWVGTALANGGPHGSYTATTDGCAGCHRTHSASAPKLLVNTNTALCLTCHGTGATGSVVNVTDGVYEGTSLGTQNAGLNGGGFTSARQDTGLTGTATSGSVTSIHTVQGMPAANGMPAYSATATMWGAGAANSAGSAFDMYCSSCHDPHGSSNYRMLKTTVNGVAVTVSATDETAKSYTTPKYHAGTASWQISSFCSACHTRYSAGAGAGSTSSGDTVFAYRHRSDAPSGSVANGITYTFPTGMILPVSTTDGAAPATGAGDNRVMVCLTCHFSHGSKAAMGFISGDVAWPGGVTTPSGSARSSLLRLDNRGICENCHPK